MMKKIVSLLLLAALAVTLFGCSEMMTSAENFLIAVKKMDFEAMKKELYPDDRAGSLHLQLDNYADSLTSEDMETLKALYSLTQYTMGEESAAEKGVKTVSVTLKYPDVARIKSLADTKIMVSAESASKTVSDMIADGSIAKSYMTEKTISVKMVEKDGVWLLPYTESDNAALVSALLLSEMLRFFALN